MNEHDTDDDRCGCYHSDCVACHGERAIACRECGARVAADCHCALAAACCEDCGRSECDCDDAPASSWAVATIPAFCQKPRGVAFCDCVNCRFRAGF